MLDITAANCSKLPTVAKPAGPKTYRIRKEAQNAAVAEIGPHAREGFEYLTEKCDGRWGWRVTDEVKPPTCAELKAMGGRKGLLAATAPRSPLGSQSAGAMSDSTKTGKRTTELPAGVARHPTEAEAVQEAGEAINAAALAQHEKRGRERAIAEGRAYPKPESKQHRTKAALIGEMLLRKNGCTTAEVLKATGWPSVSMPQQAKMVGLKLRKEKDGRVTRYYGIPKK